MMWGRRADQVCRQGWAYDHPWLTFFAATMGANTVRRGGARPEPSFGSRRCNKSGIEHEP